jgi:hypothetical protein
VSSSKAKVESSKKVEKVSNKKSLSTGAKKKATGKKVVKKAAVKKSPKTVKAAVGQKKVKKDPNAPKRALSAYMFYATEHRAEIIKKNPNVSFGEVGKLLGEAWKKAAAKEKTAYEEKAKKDKIRYEAAKAKYDAGRGIAK